MLKNPKVAVIGVGKMGINHVRVYSILKKINFSAISELNQSLGQEVGKQYKVKHYSNYQDMIGKEKPDIVSICVPTSFHYEVASYCLSKKINVLLEKPIATTVKEGETLIQLAKKYQVSLLVGHIERFNPAVIKLKQIIKSGKIGKVTSIIARRVGGFPFQIRDANIMVDLAIHDLDIVNYLLDSIPQIVNVDKHRIHTKTREDSVEYFLQYKNASAYIQSNWITPVKIRKLSITGSEGYLELDYISQQIEFYKSNYNKFKEETKGFSDFILKFSNSDKQIVKVDKKEPLTQEISYFVNQVVSGKRVVSQFAVEALKIALT